jgi:molybdenum cofactor cytidylyltransferase
MKIAAIILAAGLSSRAGGFKPLLPLGGKSLLGRCIELFREAEVHEISVVTGYRHHEIAAEAARYSAPCVYNPNFAEGMYSSICTGVLRLYGCDGFFLLPVDIPLLRPQTIPTLLRNFNGTCPVFPTFHGERGHPPLIPARLIPKILGYHGNGGLQALLAAEIGCDVAVWDQGTILDADTPEAFAVLEKQLARMAIGTPREAAALADLTMPPRGLAHGTAVSRVAEQIARALNDNGLHLDLELITNSGLLHDIAKGKAHHEECGAKLLRELGLIALAPIVAAHRDNELPKDGDLTEKDVVYLADKLVRGKTRLSVDERFKEKLELFAADAKACTAIRNRLESALACQALVERTTGLNIETILAAGRNQ